MKLFVMTGGKGARLESLTKKIPKPMIEIGGKPVLAHIVEHAKKNGIVDMVFCNGYLGDAIEKYFGNGEKFGVHIVHSTENQALGTGGALWHARDLIDEPFLVFQGDVLNGLDIEKFIGFAKNKGGLGSLVVHQSSHPYDSDIVVMDKDLRITRLMRVTRGEQFVNLTNAGAFYFTPTILKYISAHTFSMIESDVIPRAILEGEKLWGYPTNDPMNDMGTPERLESVRKKLMMEKRSLE